MPKHRKESSSSSDSGPEDRTPVKKAKGKEASERDEEGRWQLDKMRYVSINEFRGTKRIDIREFYEKDGKVLPGKKGISLSLEQFTKLGELFDEVKQAALH